MKTFYITKYVLTKGILKVQADVCAPSGGTKYASTIGGSSRTNLFEPIGRTAFESLEDAQRKAQAVLVAKLASLRKQVATCEAMLGRPFKVKTV